MATLRRCILLLLFTQAALPLGKSRLIKAIDTYCSSLQDSLTAATPFFFSGPDPWTELDDYPDGVPDPVDAYVYTIGPAIRKVLLRVADPEEDWLEEITYFYRGDGTLAKRLRHLDEPGANISLEEVTYYANGRKIKDSTHRHTLDSGKQDLSQFDDPGAPVFWTVDELPFSDMVDVWRQLA